MAYKVLVSALAATLALGGCASVANMDVSKLTEAGTTAFKAATLSDAEVQNFSAQSCAESDTQNKIAAPKDKYSLRLNKVVAGFAPSINGQPTNYKVYLTQEPNAWAMANGCIRVYSGLMDMMTDDELRGVIGHEMGHVALGHSKKAMQAAYGVSAARSAVSSAGGSVVASLSASQLGDLTEKVINAQFSQSQESAADDYSFDLLTTQKMNRKGLVTAFQKLAKLDGGKGASMLSSHPASADRAQHIQQRIDQNK
ncbi:M48 family metallopeptidase [Paraherbaspirillum soli]|uniref:M48 family metallopeptidase n=1 Tax=Paraherbaspirillum soli TaxID=631222 RepID=A0ABW0M8Q8_9BURK